MSDVNVDEIEARANAVTSEWPKCDCQLALSVDTIRALCARVRELEQENAKLKVQRAAWKEWANHVERCQWCAEGPFCKTGDALRDCIQGAESDR